MPKRRFIYEDFDKVFEVYKQPYISEMLVSDDFSCFPKEILLYLFSFLDTNTLAVISRVNKLWKEISSDNELWKSRFENATLINEESNPYAWRRFQNSLYDLDGSWKKLYFKELLYLEEVNQQRNAEIVIGTGEGGFHLSSRERGSLMNVQSREVRMWLNRSDFDGHVAYHLRDMKILINWVKSNQNSGLSRDIQIVQVPYGVEYKICTDPDDGSEWIEEIHRKWKINSKSVNSCGLEYIDIPTCRRSLQKLHIEKNDRSRKIVIDIGSEDGLNFSEKAIQLLEYYTKCTEINHLKLIPRDHPDLVQTVYQLGKKSRKNLRIISIPIDVNWFIASKYGIEYVVESYRIWPIPSSEDVTKRFPYAMIRGNQILSNMFTKLEWETTLDQMDKTERFKNVTEMLEGNW